MTETKNINTSQEIRSNETEASINVAPTTENTKQTQNNSQPSNTKQELEHNEKHDTNEEESENSKKDSMQIDQHEKTEIHPKKSKLQQEMSYDVSNTLSEITATTTTATPSSSSPTTMSSVLDRKTKLFLRKASDVEGQFSAKELRFLCK